MCCCRFLRRASLTADQVPALLQLAGAGNERQPDDDSADAPEQAPAIADSLAQLALGGGAVADEADTKEAAKSGVEGGEKLSWQLQGPTGGLTPDLDFEEFLQRQKAFVEVMAFPYDNQHWKLFGKLAVRCWSAFANLLLLEKTHGRTPQPLVQQIKLARELSSLT